MNKKKSQHKHARKRALERYGIDYSENLKNELRGKIKRKSQAKFLYKSSLRVSVWEIEHNDNKFKVVYDKKRKNIVTFLPLKRKLRFR